MPKKLFKIVGYTLLALILILLLAPWLFKGKIMQFAKAQLNEYVLGESDFSDLSISFFRNFPNVSVGIQDFYIKGINEFKNDTLISAKEFAVTVNPYSFVFGDTWKINRITVETPRIKALVNKDGAANWEIIKDTEEVEDTTTVEEPFTFNLNLKEYIIRNGYIYYNDKTLNVATEIEALNHSGKGNFTESIFTLFTTTSADAVTVVYEGIPYLSNVKTAIDADIEIDNTQDKYSFNTDKIHLNALNLSTNGYFQFVNDTTYGMDIQFKAPSTEFKHILSMVPAIYRNDFDKIQTSGTALLEGFVKGEYNDYVMPAYNAKLVVNDGFFQYPDLPKPVKNIQIDAEVNNPDGQLDNTIVKVSKAHIEFGNDPFDMHLFFEKPETAQNVDLWAKGKLNLASITEFVKFEEGTTLKGLLDADLTAKGSLAGLQQNMNAPFAASGYVQFADIYYSSKDFPQPVQNTRARITVNNPGGPADLTTVAISNGHVEVGKDIVDFSANIKTPISDPNVQAQLKGNFNLANIEQFYPLEDMSIAGLLQANLGAAFKMSQIEKEQYDAIRFDGSVQLDDLLVKTPDFKDGIEVKNASMQFNPSNVQLSNLEGKILSTRYKVNGSLQNLLGYALKDEVLSGTVNAYANLVDADEWMAWMGEDTAAASEEEEPLSVFPVPANLNLKLQAAVDKLIYDKVEYEQIKGGLTIKDETVQLNNMSMKALDGSLTLNGSYSTKQSKQQPDIALQYKISNVDVQKTFKAYNTVQALMPIGSFISGKLNSDLTLTGKLGNDMFPLLNSLTGEGTLFLLEGVLNKFEPLDKIATSLNVNALKEISVKDVKNYFEFTNGKVMVKPFTVKLKDIDMEIGGMHGIDQSIDYVVNIDMPRSMLGSGANQLINNLSSQAAAKGVPVNVGETVHFKVNLGGSITQPTVKTDLKNTAGSVADELKEQANEFIAEKKAIADSIVAEKKAAAKDTLSSIKEQVIKDATSSLKDKLLGGSKDSTDTKDSVSTKEKVEEKAKGLIKGLIKKN